MPSTELSIGQMAARTGLSVSAIRFYEAKGLITPPRNFGGQRRYPRRDLRRMSFIMIAQRLGFPLAEIRDALAALPEGRAPTPADWEALATGFRAKLDQRIALLSELRDTLTGCIGCGCLSMTTCALHNAADWKAAQGPGPRSILDAASP